VTSKHRRTLAGIFERPTRKDLRFAAVEALLLALGAKKKERAGSRVAFILHGGVLLLHRPHSPVVLRPGAVEDLRDFLASKGITPETT
jgi:hypothetical protein